MKANVEIRARIEKRRFRFYEVADVLGICPETFSRWLRHPLNDERKRKVTNALRKLEKEQDKIIR